MVYQLSSIKKKKKNWSIVIDDVCSACLDVLNGSGNVRAMNQTLIALTLKLDLPMQALEF